MKKTHLFTTKEWLEKLRIKIFASADSLDEAREDAYTALPDSPKHHVDAALDRYHNTLIETVKQHANE
ncbi:hypothetical protein IT774_07555 [Salinimonas marina]|uniref:Uncharacterized protein n=1 Tax=Salinimonas marina TaxID=2785918 RepID=A0A7S9HE86_9ALTE|nr:hypothetical protein [Salinimonas marina]QPG06950.1 hypothetical protein IT774_07555 [Salinimonas marina]